MPFQSETTPQAKMSTKPTPAVCESAKAEFPPTASANAAASHPQTLDPTDWTELRAQAHRMLDDMLDYTEDIRQRPVWQPIPDIVRGNFRTPIPHEPTPLEDVHAEFLQYILPFTQGNVHPGFMGWVNGGGTAVGMIAEMLAAGLNANLGGRDHMPVEVERQLIEWVRDIFGFPTGASGLFVTGTSMANAIAVVVARDVALGYDVRTNGIGPNDIGTNAHRLTAYASAGAHSCIAKALDLAGIGTGALRLVRTDARGRIDQAALQQAIADDRSAGRVPFLVVGTAGTVDIGAVDDLATLADLCHREKLWFHVDGAFGALATLTPDLAPLLHGIEQADSLAFDFHKWAQVPFDAGFILVRDGELHRRAFASSAAYLTQSERGLAAGAPWLSDFGPDLSRGFRALKTWFTLKVYGTDAIGAVISQTCRLARSLRDRILQTPELELLAPVELNIVCFRYRAEPSNEFNRELVIQLQEHGRVAPSTTMIGDRLAIRAAIVNHRTSQAEIDALLDDTLALGKALKLRQTP